MTATILEFPPPPRIPVSGANVRDVERTVEHLTLGHDLMLSAITELGKRYRDIVIKALNNHNENIPITAEHARPVSFVYGWEALFEDFARNFEYLHDDLVNDVSRALPSLEE